jgi:hypothetical protein
VPFGIAAELAAAVGQHAQQLDSQPSCSSGSEPSSFKPTRCSTATRNNSSH